MNIDISVLVWTILCFLALMWILNRLLFRPVLQVMERRQEKIDAGIEAGRATAAALQAQAEKSRDALDARRAEEMTRTEKALLAVREDGLREIASANQEMNVSFQSLSERLSQKASGLDAALDAETTRLARMLANRLIAEDGSNETAVWYN